MRTRRIRISHRPTGTVIAEGPVGWGITPFEGNYYIRKKYLRAGVLEVTPLPGLCPYKGLYQWLALRPDDGTKIPGLAWLYWLPNPLFPFIWFRAAVWGGHPDIAVEEM